jgi:hypothetical protein
MHLTDCNIDIGWRLPALRLVAKFFLRDAIGTFLIGVVVQLFAPAASPVDAGMFIYEFSFENDGDLTEAPFGTLTVVDGYNTAAMVNTLTFTIDIDQTKLLGTPDIHQFGFQLDFAGLVDLVPKPQIVGSGSDTFELRKLDMLDKVSGFGKTKWNYVADFGRGANPTLDPVTFTIGGLGLSLSALNPADTAYKNNIVSPQNAVANFAVHVQSTGADRTGSEGLGGFYDPVSVVPENGNMRAAVAAIATGLVCLVVISLRPKLS